MRQLASSAPVETFAFERISASAPFLTLALLKVADLRQRFLHLSLAECDTTFRAGALWPRFV
jgi:hypothetical protein